jgi:hypothetical protein
MPNKSRKLAAVPPRPALELGEHDVNLECPDCHALFRTPFTLDAVKTATRQKSLLKLQMTNNKALQHTCGGGADGHGTAAMFDDNGEAAEPADADPFGGDPFGGAK